MKLIKERWSSHKKIKNIIIKQLNKQSQPEAPKLRRTTQSPLINQLCHNFSTNIILLSFLIKPVITVRWECNIFHLQLRWDINQKNFVYSRREVYCRILQLIILIFVKKNPLLSKLKSVFNVNMKAEIRLLIICYFVKSVINHSRKD